MTSTTAVTADSQSSRGNCPATGRSAGACADQTHAACYVGNAESQALDRKVEREHARLDESY